ncbi:ATP-dependent helicase/nuclease subunit A [Ferriphaselus amnicola]|uniref:DNA 3'-5' helicase n=1 Tax=Ferriphaselus amnicola TaxID=1188319 RepID=A0A2Z6GAC9_9PROT|nr:UvrD-helicase domain-containing protein [Ferriphaselus amnicola]BBE50437.1 ATP-dependent helicase/nuclease subunit A [Ferriphaselus amnicola]
MDNHTALDPTRSIVVEACAGSGKTWLLVSRVVRLLLAGGKPAEILAITFTRKAAQEMQQRLHDWLHLLAVADDEKVRQFLRERALAEAEVEAALPRARALFAEVLQAQPPLTINTFHGWFMQLMQRAPLAAAPGGVSLLEKTQALQDEAWRMFADQLGDAPGSVTEQAMQALLAEIGLHSTQALLFKFVALRNEWQAYVAGQGEPVDWALAQLRDELEIDESRDPVAEWAQDGRSEQAVMAFAGQWAAGGTAKQKESASALEQAWTDNVGEARFVAVWALLFTQKDERRALKSTAKQNADAFLLARDALFAQLEALRGELDDRKVYAINTYALRCGAALLDCYQSLKQRQQQMDFGDLEWQAARLLNDSDHAEYMQYKLDSRYKHVLLDEFQDTNPLQWQILKAWFAAADAVDSRPTIFMVGDPKQSIYRFRRADARIFDVVREFLQEHYGAAHQKRNVTRRNAPAVLAAVNGVFEGQPVFHDFVTHESHNVGLPGYVEVLELAQVEKAEAEPAGALVLRNPLLEARAEKGGSAREAEAEQFAARVAEIVGNWHVHDEDGTVRPAQYGDLMVLVRKRTHLAIYEQALRQRHIPFVTSRRGGLLETLEALDLQALLTFLITPFADLQLAQVLRSPLFGCGDGELLQLAAVEEGSWWRRLQLLVESGTSSPLLQRAERLLRNWLNLADRLPVHDLLDRIYFEADAMARYRAAVPPEFREQVCANLQAFLHIALNVDAGRYPSLPRFLQELAELRAASDNESPDEGKLGAVGNALRFLTVHESKGLEAPIVWLIDANDAREKSDSYGVLLDWSPDEKQPNHFSLYTTQKARGIKRDAYFSAEEKLAEREAMNLLYVAMTRAKQALLVSGNEKLSEGSWYGRIAAALDALTVAGNPLLREALSVAETVAVSAPEVDAALTRPIPTGQRRASLSEAQRRGIKLHALLQHLATDTPRPLGEVVSGIALSDADAALLRSRCNLSTAELEVLLPQAQTLLAQPHLHRFFDPLQFQRACNELPYVSADGELRRIDRLVEFDDEVWVLDYKMGESANLSRHTMQMEQYRAAMQTVYPAKSVRCALLFADGLLHEVVTS